MKKFELDKIEAVPGSDTARRLLLNAQYILSIEPERLLYNFRTACGQLPKEEPYGGWEAPDWGFRGHFTGHYLSALSKASITLRPLNNSLADEMKNRAEKLIDALLECQQAFGRIEPYYGYIAAVPSAALDEAETLQIPSKYWVPYYTYQKTFNGLMDAYQYAGSKKALDIASDFADYIGFRMSRLNREQQLAMLDTRWYCGCDDARYHMEFGAMHEALTRLSELTGNKRIRETAEIFERIWFTEMLAHNDDKLGYFSFHVNTEVANVRGLTYTSKDAVVNFMTMLKNGHQLPTGGASGRSAYPNPADYGGELFDFSDMMYKHLSRASGESCVSHNLNDLSSDVFEWSCDAEWAGQSDMRYVNAVLAQQNPADGHFIYNLHMCQGARKDYSDYGFYCCDGSGIEYYTCLLKNFYHRNKDSFYMSGYASSRVYWDEKGVVITTDTDYPDSGNIDIKIETSAAAEFALNLHIPHWAKGAQTFINGKKAEALLPSSIFTVKRFWKNGDKISLKLPYSLRHDFLTDRPEYACFYYGPHLLAACADAFAVFDGTREQLCDTLEPAGQPNEFKAVLSTGEVTFKPIKDITHETYNAFTIVSIPHASIITDTLIIGSEESRESHVFEGSKVTLGSVAGIPFAEAEPDGYIQAEFKINPDKKMLLTVYYAPDEAVEILNRLADGEGDSRWLEIHANDRVIAVQTLPKDEYAALGYVHYPIPAGLTKGQTALTIRFSSKPYESRLSKAGRLFDKIETRHY